MRKLSVLAWILAVVLWISACAVPGNSNPVDPGNDSSWAVTEPESPTGKDASSEASTETEEPTETEVPMESETEPESESEPESETEPEVTLTYVDGYRVKITADSARIRGGASLSSNVVGGANKGAVLNVTGVEGAFYCVTYSGGTGYLHYSVAEYGPFEEPVETVSPETNTPAVTPTTTPSVPTTVGNIHALSADELNELRSAYSTAATGYGGINQASYAVGLQNTLNALPSAGRALVDNGAQTTVALTFCLGWENTYNGRPITDQALDILAAAGVKATFFITHSYAAHNQAIVRRMINEGHQVGSHTYACPDGGIASHSLEDIMNDALRMQQYMLDTFGYEMTLYNYNSGTWSPASIVMLTRMGYIITLCSASYSDYDANAAIDAGYWAGRLNAALSPGTIYAFHLTNKATLEILPSIIANVNAAGYTFTNIH